MEEIKKGDFIKLSLAATLGVGLLDIFATLNGKAMHPDFKPWLDLNYYGGISVLLLLTFTFICCFIVLRIHKEKFWAIFSYSYFIVYFSFISIIIRKNFASGWVFFLLWGLLSISVYLYFDSPFSKKSDQDNVKMAHAEYLELFKLSTTIFLFMFVGIIFTYILNIQKNSTYSNEQIRSIYIYLSPIIGYLILCASLGISYPLYKKVRFIRSYLENK